MSSRTNIRPHAVISNGDMSLSSIVSQPTILQSISKFSYEVSWSGSSPVGTLALQISNSYAANPDGSANNAGVWTAVPLDVAGTEVASIPISGSPNNGFIDVTVQAGYAARLVYTRTSGSGSLNCVVVGKVS